MFVAPNEPTWLQAVLSGVELLAKFDSIRCRGNVERTYVVQGHGAAGTVNARGFNPFTM